MSDIYQPRYLAFLRQRINDHFSTDEIRSLCFELGVDSEELGVTQSPKSIFILNLITYLLRRDRLGDLIRICAQIRPRVTWWPEASTAEPPIQSPLQFNKSKERLRVFLCHSSQDKIAVRGLYRKLLASGFEPWLDEENLLSGQDWELEITKAIRGSHVIIVCLSQESTGKIGFVQKEIRFALDRALEQPEGAIFLIPLKLTPCEIPFRLEKFQWVNYYEENGYQNLMRALHARVDNLFH